jgi:hypothetical protein
VGQSVRYDFRFIGYRDGEFDLADHLTRDGDWPIPSIRVWVSRSQASTVPGELDRTVRLTPVAPTASCWSSVVVPAALASSWVACTAWTLVRWRQRNRAPDPGVAAPAEAHRDGPAPKPELLKLARLVLEGQLDEAKKIRFLALWQEWKGKAGEGHVDPVERWVLRPSKEGATEKAVTRLLLDLLGNQTAQPD